MEELRISHLCKFMGSNAVNAINYNAVINFTNLPMYDLAHMYILLIVIYIHPAWGKHIGNAGSLAVENL
jgi:hypothetical protein